MALRGYETGALNPADWERSTRSGGRVKKPEPEKLPKSNLGGDLIDGEKLSRVIEAAEKDSGQAI